MQCNICGNHKMALFHKGVRDNHNIDVYKCAQCGLLQLSQTVVDRNHYEDGKMRQNQYMAVNDSYGEETWELWRQETMQDDIRRESFLRELCNGKNVLDFGCGNGGFMANISSSVKKIVGIELDLNARKKLKEEGFEVDSDIENIGGSWDVITLFQVIEHLDEPRKWLKHFLGYLKGGGYLVIETPNADDALISLYNNEAFMDFTFWSEHLMLYNSDNLEKLMSECGYEAVDNSQIQRYPLSNHLFWLSNNRPGGHMKWDIFNGKELNIFYEMVLKAEKKCDTLFGVFQKR